MDFHNFHFLNHLQKFYREDKNNFLTLIIVFFLSILTCLFFYFAPPLTTFKETPILAWRIIISPFFVCTVVVSALIACCISLKQHNRILISAKKIGAISLFFCFYSLTYNHFSLIALSEIVLSVLFCLAYFCITIALFRKVAYATTLLFFLPELFYLLARLNGADLSINNLVQVFGTSTKDALVYLTVENIFLFSLAIALIFGFHYLLARFLSKEKRMTLLSTGSIFLLFFSVSFSTILPRFSFGTNAIFPLGQILNLTQSTAIAWINFNKAKTVTLSFATNPECPSTINTLQGNEGVICIIHIGESLLASHLGINGYKHDTTPWLNNQQNIINFKDCTSVACFTDRAIICMLTDCPDSFITSSTPPKFGALSDYFTANNFTSLSFWDKGANNPAIGGDLFAAEVNYLTRNSTYMENVGANNSSQVRTIHQAINNSPGKNVFLTINNYGSHINFTNFDHQNPRFKPVRLCATTDDPANNPEDAANMIRCYDNTVFNTDDYIKKLLTPLQGKPYVYIYMSDHGEYLGDRGFWLRPNVPESEFFKCDACQVPFFIIASPEFEALHPHFREALHNLRQNKDLAVSQAHLFHTVLGLMGIETSVYDEKLDLTTPKVQPYIGPHPSRDGQALPPQ